jgi:hypothetical protein
MFIVTAAHRCFCVFSIMPIFFSLPVLVAAAAAVVAVQILAMRLASMLRSLA